MRISSRGIELIKRHEGLVLRSYLCPAKVWTIGYGHTRGVKGGQVITKEQAEKFLKEDLKSCELTILRLVRKPLTQNQFDALVSFVFNIGAGNFQNSTLLKRINKNPTDPDIKRQFNRWVYAKGEVLSGLIKRREEESNLYFKI